MQRNYRYYDFLMAGFVTALLCSNLIGPAKICRLPLPDWLAPFGSELVFGAASLFFPISYILSDVLTEIYGYARARRAIWAGFGAMLFASAMSQGVIAFTPSADEPFNQQLQPALEIVFGNTWRIVCASLLAFWIGDFANSYLLARMKVWTEGRWLWTRTIGSTVVGQGLDSLVFFPIAFYGIWDGEILLRALTFNWGFKVAVEVLMTPATYLAVYWLRRREGVDHYDRDTDFTPFSLADG